jgi:Protein of unknown function (DUF2752)
MLPEAEWGQPSGVNPTPAWPGTVLPPKGRAPGARRSWRDVPVLWAGLALLAGLAGLVLFCFDPRQYHFYPVCFFYRTTGLLCPGCGGLRAMYQLLHGHLATAFRFNPVLVVSLPVLAWVGARYGWRKARNEPASFDVRPLWLWLILAAVLVISVLRNLPGAPFALLRP